MPPPLDPLVAVSHLRAADPTMARIVEQVGSFAMRPPGEDAFQALARSIMLQQISGAAGAAIYGRFTALFPGGAGTAPEWDGPGGAFPRPIDVLSVSDEALRSAGLSRQKAAAVRSLAEHFASGDLGDQPFATLDDEVIIQRLTQVRGVGRWTAQMFLMFQLRRPDVLPVNDVGINRAIARRYGLAAPPAPADVLRIGAPWRPHATVACWYLWRSEDVRLPG